MSRRILLAMGVLLAGVNVWADDTPPTPIDVKRQMESIDYSLKSLVVLRFTKADLERKLIETEIQEKRVMEAIKRKVTELEVDVDQFGILKRLMAK